ncbi:MAG: right-handed parallel beta-helix repeat-containing protein [Pseudomonadota bacterium]
MHVIHRWMLTVAAALALPVAADAAQTSIYFSPTGSDQADGSAAAKAVKTFDRALQLAQAAGASADVTIRFLDGDFGDATMKVTWPHGAKSRLTLEAEKGKVVFDGKGSGKTWVQVVDAPGPEANVAIRGFVVRNYRQAIQFGGDRFAKEPSMTNNLVENNVFENIGQFKEGVEPALAAIHMLNTSHTTIQANVFRNVRNLQRCDGLHAIYMAGGSSYNVITGNLFDGGCGDTVKTRDRSNFNKIEGNEFANQSGRSLFVDSFCDARKQPECKGSHQECPSWGNVFRGNRVDQSSRASVKFVQRHVGASNVPACPLPQGGASSPRIVADD